MNPKNTLTRNNSNYSLNDLFAEDSDDSSCVTEAVIEENPQTMLSDVNDKLIGLVHRLNNNLEYICEELKLLKKITNIISVFNVLLTSYLIYDYVFN